MNALLMAAGAAAAFTGVLLGWRLARDPGVALPAGFEVLVADSRPRTSLLGRLLASLDRVLGVRALGLVSATSRRKVDAAIARAGRSDELSYENVIARQATWAFIALAGVAVFIAQGTVVLLAVPVLGWFFPRITLWLAGRKRDETIERELPDFLDVMAVTISAGLGFRAALRRVATLVAGPVGEEMLRVLRQIEIGASRRAAFAAMRERSRSEALNAFVTAFLQAEELGAPISDFLTEYASELRRGSAQRARAAASRANPKISLVLTLVIMPALTIFMIGAIVITSFREF